MEYKLTNVKDPIFTNTIYKNGDSTNIAYKISRKWYNTDDVREHFYHFFYNSYEVDTIKSLSAKDVIDITNGEITEEDLFLESI